MREERPPSAVNPEEFLRTVLHIDPKDAETVREKVAEAMEREDRKRVEDADRGGE